MTSTEPRAADAAAPKHRRSRTWKVVAGVIVVFFAIVAAAQFLPGQSGSSPPPASSETSSADKPADGTQELDFVRRTADDPMAIGDVDAPVVMTEWIDLRCPFCAVVSRDTMPTLIEKYVDTGKVRIEFYDVAYFGEKSEDAAVAARAAGNQDKYVEFVTAVYAAAPERGHPDLPRDALIDFAKKAGVPDVDRFTAELDDPGLREDVQKSTRSAQQLGVTGVPFFVTGRTALSGAQPTGNFEKFLDEALAEAR
ncbi:DsbA family protein [Actinomadura welshii]